jgi:hypothetical protein
MADKTKDSSKLAFAAESQQERWLKYGANVALTIVIVIALGGFLVYLAQKHNVRKDTTYEGVYSLKPQTVTLLKDLPQKVKIVGLFSTAKQEQQTKDKDDTNEVRYQQVSDLLQEYQEKSGGKITVEMIDPINNPGKVDQLFNEVARKYGNDFNKYEQIVKEYPETLKQIRSLTKAEADALKKLPETQDKKLGQLIDLAGRTLEGVPERLDRINTDAQEELKQKVPDYKRIVDNVRASLEGLSKLMDQIATLYKQQADQKETPAEFKAYFAEAQPRLEALKKPSAELLKKAENLGSIKQIDELRENKSNSIAVMAESDMKVLPLSSIYRVDAPRYMDADPTKVKPRFAGEQQVSTALVSLTSKDKKKVAFIRSGGEPMTSLPMFGYRGPFALVADRLKEFNTEILENDVSGRWAQQVMQSQMQQRGMPLPPDATPEQLKDAVWVVRVTPQNPQEMMMNPGAGSIGPKLSEHLKNGGSAMLMVYPQTEKMDFLKEWGIETKPDYVIVHDRIEQTGARGADRTADWMRQQPVFGIDQYGDHPITKPVQSLDGFFAPVIPVATVDAKGVKTTPLLPIPKTPTAWAEGDFDSLRKREQVKFGGNKEGAPADLPLPLFAGAAAENDKGGRLVVIGCADFAMDDLLQEPDIEMLQSQGRLVPRYPGNAELFINSIHWLTKMDTMIAISPTALEVPRVAPIGDGALGFWRVGVLIIGLPLLVLVSGTLVYLKRRD